MRRIIELCEMFDNAPLTETYEALDLKLNHIDFDTNEKTLELVMAGAQVKEYFDSQYFTRQFVTKKDNLKALSIGLGFSAGVMICSCFRIGLITQDQIGIHCGVDSRFNTIQSKTMIVEIIGRIHLQEKKKILQLTKERKKTTWNM